MPLQGIVEKRGILNPQGVLYFNDQGILGNSGCAKVSDYEELRALKLTQDGFGLYDLSGKKLLIYGTDDGVLVIYQ